MAHPAVIAVTARRRSISSLPLLGSLGRRIQGLGGGVEGADARVLLAGAPDQPKRQGRQVVDGDEDDVTAVEDGDV
jgi:hypothetical protein